MSSAPVSNLVADLEHRGRPFETDTIFKPSLRLCVQRPFPHPR